MEKQLTKLFDYQRFAGNRQLQSVIDSVHKQSRQLLLDDDAELIAAAGTLYNKTANNDGKKLMAGDAHGPS